MNATNEIKTGTLEIGKLRNGGDIVARKVMDGESSYVKIFQREKKHFLLQPFFRLHDLCSKNHINVTANLAKNSENLVGAENNSISKFLNIKKDINKQETLKINSEEINYYFSQKNNNEFIKFLTNISNPVTSFSLTEPPNANSSEKFKDTEKTLLSAVRIIARKNMDLKAEQPNTVLTSSSCRDDLEYFFKSEITYYNFEMCEHFKQIKNLLNLPSVRNDSDLKKLVGEEELKQLEKLIEFLDAKLFHGPNEISLQLIKDEFQSKLDTDKCNILYEKYSKSDWNEEKYGNIVDYIFNALSSDFSKMPIDICEFLCKVFDDLQKENAAEKKITPCFVRKIDLHLKPLRDRVQAFNKENFLKL